MELKIQTLIFSTLIISLSLLFSSYVEDEHAININDLTLTPVITGDTLICEGDCTFLDAGIYDSYLWSGGETTQTISPCQGGTYTVTVADATGCTGTSEVTVEEIPYSTPFTAWAPLCEGECTTIGIFGLYDAYSWSTGETSSTIEVCTGGTYLVTVTGSNGCSSTSEAIVTAFSATLASSTSANCSVCDGTASVEVNTSGNTIYQWSNGSTSANPTNLCPGTNTVTVTNGSSCSSIVEVEIEDITIGCCYTPSNANATPTATSALITWSSDNEESQLAQVKYRLKGTTAWLTTGTDDTQRNIPNLTPKKYYQYKVREKCGDTWSDFTKIETFYTSACDVPTGIASIYLDSTRMRVRWDNNPDEIKAKIRYRVVGDEDWLTQDSQNGNNFLYVNDFPAGATTVEYRLRSNCDGNDWSEYSPLMYHSLETPARIAQTEALTATNIYPNPTKDVLNIEFETKDAEEVSIIITDNLGKVISSRNNTYGQGIQKESLAISELANGYYFVIIQSKDRMETKKFVKI